MALLVATAVTVSCSEGDGTGGASPRDTAATGSVLFGAVLDVIDGEVWVHGGLVGDEGTSPPVTSALPPGWEPNRTIVAYGSDGQERGRHLLPELSGQSLGGRVVGSEGSRYLLTTLCPGALGCGRDVEPALFRLDGEITEQVDLDLPPDDAPPDAAVGHMLPLGVVDGTAWVMQQVGAFGSDARAEHRLLSIDLATGSGLEVAVPDGLGDLPGRFCVAGDRLIAVTSVDAPDGSAIDVRVLEHRPGSGSPDWAVVASLPRQPVGSLAGAVHCPSAYESVIFGLAGQMVSVPLVGDGEISARPVLPGHLDRMLGEIDGAMVAVAWGDDRVPQLWSSDDPAVGWQPGPYLPSGDSRDLVIIDGALYEASVARGSPAATDPAVRPLSLD